MSSDNITVFIEEECGYAYWLWAPGISRDSLIDWWKKLETVDPYFYEVDNLPFGTIVRLDPFGNSSDEKIVAQNCNYLDLYGKKIENDGSLVASLYMHLHTDGDSVLLISGSEKHIRHKGYDPDYYSVSD